MQTLPKEKQSIARDINLYGQPDFEMMLALFLGTMATGKLAKGSNAAATTSAPTPAATAAATTSALTPAATATASISAPTPAATAAATTSALTPAATATASISAPTPAATTTASTSASTSAPTPAATLAPTPAAMLPPLIRPAATASSTQLPTAFYDDWNIFNDENDPYHFEDLPPPDNIYTQMLVQQPTPCPTRAAAAADVTPASKAPVYGAQFPVSNQASRKRKDATENNTPVGERPKQSHSNLPSAGAELAPLMNNISSILNALNPGPDPASAPTCPPPPPPTKPDDYASLTSGVQVALAVAKKLHQILKLYNGKFNREECNWLHTSLAFCYTELLESPH
ncbi:hypothetical protein HDU78_010029 [Chytriomyces hyalinus]|nr:hypothetical protein HDU78_010029 [Chytriomyces hyalinus]